MVGVPHSKGCSLCVKRRVKCDQAVPACVKCVKYGVDCPGYDKTLKFVSGKHAVRTRSTRGQGAGSPRGTATQSDSSSKSASDRELATPPDSATQAGAPSRARGRGRELPPPSVPAALREECVPFVYNMMAELFSIHRREEVAFTAPWFTSMLAYLGRVPVLDTAMSAYVLQLVGRAKKNPADISRSRDIYGLSLGALQRALNHPVAWKTTETLAATIICCNFELFAGTHDPLTWMLHITGISKLIQQRGPASFSSTFEKALLRGVRPLIVIKAIFSDHNCFLDHPKWRRLSESLSFDEARDANSSLFEPAGVLPAQLINYHDTYFVLMAQMPSIIRAGYSIREAKRRGLEPDPMLLSQLKQEATKLREEYISWYKNALSAGAFRLPAEVPSLDPTSPFHSVLKFSSPWVGSLVISYWANMLIIQESLEQLQPGTKRSFTHNNLELASNVLRSLEHVGEGIMGPFRVGYAVRIVYDFVNTPLQLWTLSKVSKYHEICAALSRDVYPHNPALERSGMDMQAADEAVVTHAITWID